MCSHQSEDFTRLMKAYLPEKHWNIMKGPWNGWKEMYGATKQEFINDVITFASFPGSSGYFDLEIAAPYISVPATVTLEKSISIGDVFKMTTKMLPAHGKDPNYTSIQNLIENLHQEKPIGKNIQFYEKLLNWVGFLTNDLRKFVDSHPKLFMPRVPGQYNEISFARVFDDGMDKFLLDKEVRRGVREMKTDSSKDAMETEDDGNKLFKYYTVRFEEVAPLFDHYVDKWKAVKTDIAHRHKHRATFIPFFDGEYCIRGADLFLEIWEEVINVHGYLQRLNNNHWMHIKALIYQLGHSINRPTAGEQFINVCDALRIKREFLKDMKKILEQYPTHIKEVRQLDGKGFTIEKMKNEVSRLGLMVSFDPDEVMKRVVLYFNHFDELKKEKVFKTCDLYDALGRLQLALLATRFTGVYCFLHLYHVCDFLLEPCIVCNDSVSWRLTSNPQYTSLEEGESEKENTPSEGESLEEEVNIGTEKRKEKRKRQAEKKKVTSESRRTLEDVVNFVESSRAPSTSGLSQQVSSVEALSAAPPPHDAQPSVASQQLNQNPVEPQVVEAPLGLDAPQANNAPEVAQAPTVPKSEPVPGACMKCFRTSQFCEDAKTKLREEQIKNKALRKQVRQGAEREAEKDKNLGDKDEEIRLLKERIAALEALNQKNDDTEDDDDPPLRFLAPTNKNSQFSDEVRNKFNELLNLKDTQYTVEREAIRRANEVVKEANDNGNKQMARLELRCIQQKYTEYIKVVDHNLSLIREHKSVENLKPLPEIPRFSENFEEIYQVVVMKELKDKTCLFCCMEMEDLKESIKCGCSRRYHRHCACDVDAKGFKCLCTRKLPLD
ncbi:hypothetical protein CAEBREN_08016 [Caenorhabditis brenneri]|uniref:DUF7809 domain-containing protein n=1 Tax=Caenorhabditis brenneri TaxID=135651 RepID=G0NHU9_CAEBE|nr:hypothetical protein CAEBREN_08016 [Caenorhabditis brenneri]